MSYYALVCYFLTLGNNWIQAEMKSKFLSETIGFSK